jgi:cell division protein FtsW
MITVSRADTSTLGRWWWTIDRWTLAALMLLIGFGYVMMLATSAAESAAAASKSIFFAKQVVFLGLAAAMLLIVSMATPRQVRLLAWLGLAGALVAVAATLVVGADVKGAKRWLNVPGFGTVQPSEVLKPCFAVVAAWLITEGRVHRRHLATIVAIVIFGIVALLLKSQPDIGMLLVVAAVFFAQFFVAGLNVVLVAGIGAAGIGLAGLAYMIFPHVQSRVQRFLNPDSGDTFQIDRSLQAFAHGGLLGRGPGEGQLKVSLPDARNDFVFAVIGEEFGLLVCLLVLLLFGFIVVRGLFRLLRETDVFVAVAATGLLTQFGLQAFVNMASALHMIPTKGMTLPLVSHGGSSMLGIALGMGMLLALTKRRLTRAETDR